MPVSDFRNPSTDDDQSTGPGGPGGPGGPAGPSGPAGPVGPGGPSTPSGPAGYGNGPLSQSDHEKIKSKLINYNEKYKSASPALFRETVITQTMTTLIRTMKPNPLLVGPAGVGKTRIVEDIARMIANNDPAVPAQLRNKVIYEIPYASIISGTQMRGMLEETMMQLVDFATDPSENAILFMDEIHQMVDQNDPQARTISQILKPAIARGAMSLIGATTTVEAREFTKDPAMGRRFDTVIVNELTASQTEEILMLARTSMLKHYGSTVAISDDTLADVVRIAGNYATDESRRPDNALTLMDQAMASVVTQRTRSLAKAQASGDPMIMSMLQANPMVVVTRDRVERVAAQRASGSATAHGFNLKSFTKGLSKIKGQDHALKRITEVMRRQSMQLFPATTPTTMLLVGPSGVGKTETAKMIAEHLTGEELIRLDMNEFSEEMAITKLIGSPPGYIGSDSKAELPLEKLVSNPYQVVLLDEIEKAHQKVQHLFLSALDEGYMRMNSGQLVDFSRAVVIATTNAGADTLSKPSLGFAAATESSVRTESQIVEVLKKENWFKPEFLSRFRTIVAYEKIGRDSYREILVSEYLMQRDTVIDHNPASGQFLPETLSEDNIDTMMAGYNAIQGARPAQQSVRAWIEDYLTTAIYGNGDSLDDDGTDHAAVAAATVLDDTSNTAVSVIDTCDDETGEPDPWPSQD